MSRKSIISAAGFLTALNLLAAVVASSTSSHAANSSTNVAALAKDPAFAKAVFAVVQTCKVNLDLARLECP
jgi:hypothetical protein